MWILTCILHHKYFQWIFVNCALVLIGYSLLWMFQEVAEMPIYIPWLIPFSLHLIVTLWWGCFECFFHGGLLVWCNVRYPRYMLFLFYVLWLLVGLILQSLHNVIFHSLFFSDPPVVFSFMDQSWCPYLFVLHDWLIWTLVTLQPCVQKSPLGSIIAI